MRRRITGGALLTIAALLLAGAGPVHAETETGAVTDAVPVTETQAAAVARPFGSHPSSFPAGAVDPSGGVSAADAATAEAYDAWKASYLVAGCGPGRYYVDASSATDSLVVSEGQGYGMVVTALMAGHDPAARTAFDGLYRYVQDHPSSSDPGLMAWHQDEACADYPNDDSSATDGDLDIAFGLLLADTQWGSSGPIDYATEALEVIAALKRSAINPDTYLPQLGDWTEPGSDYWFATRPSDIMVDRFTAFQNATGDEFWGRVARATSALVVTLQRQFAPETGLLPDFVVDTDSSPRPAPPNFLESADDGAYGYNAARVPWRLASSALIAGDAASAAAVSRISSWITSSTAGRPARIVAGYELDGTPLVDYTDLVFTAPFGAGAATDARDQAWVDRVWGILQAEGSGGYFGDSLRLQVMLLLSGNSWLPAPLVSPAVTRVGGADRYAVAAEASARTFAPGTAVAYVASGEVFPDALSASAAAGAQGAPVLLVQRDGIPATVVAELGRLAPQRIVLLGGRNTIGPAAEAALGGLAPEVERIDGADRYAVSAAVSSKTFAPGGQVAYVASGEVFPDALAGSAAAGARGAPVLLTQKSSVPAAVAAELRRLAPAAIVLLGGPNSVSSATEAALDRIAPTTRVFGADRFAAAGAVAASVFAPVRTTTVYVASGEVFPDALSASAVAVADHAPVLLVNRDSVPAGTATALDALRPTRIIVLGGPNTVTPAALTSLSAHLAP
ncbi:MAG: glycosyl hydrolase family 8 [Herbiconiux sp.]|nr:glycosyl hydrolase family 8 [Herbiconiux sp.]